MAGRFPALHVDHVSAAVPAIAPAFTALAEVLPLDVETPTTAGYDADFRWTDFWLGDRKLELIESARPGSFVERFLARRGPGMHHLSLDVEDGGLDDYLATLERDGLRIVDRGEYEGGSRTAFISPRTSPGILVQFWEIPGYRGGRFGAARAPLAERIGVRFRFDHLAIAVHDPGAARAWFARTFGASAGAADGDVLRIDVAGYPLGLVRVEGAEGFRHVALAVDRLAPLRDAGVPLVAAGRGHARLDVGGFRFVLHESPDLDG